MPSEGCHVVKFGDSGKFSIFLYPSFALSLPAFQPLPFSGLKSLEYLSVDQLRTIKNNLTFSLLFKSSVRNIYTFSLFKEPKKEKWGKGLTKVKMWCGPRGAAGTHSTPWGPVGVHGDRPWTPSLQSVLRCSEVVESSFGIWLLADITVCLRCSVING